MLTRIVCYFLYFVTCGLLEAVFSRLHTRGHGGQEEASNGISLDAITDPEEEQSYRAAGGSQSGGKSKRGTIYDVNVRHLPMVTRCGCWFRSNKIVPVLLPASPEGVADLYAANARDNRKPDNGTTDDKSKDASNEIALDFSGMKDSFSMRKNSSLALQSFATCARLNASFMRETTWKAAENEQRNGESCSTSDSTGTPPSRRSFLSKISFASNLIKKTNLDRRKERVVTANSEGEPQVSKEQSSDLSKQEGKKTKVFPQSSLEKSPQKKRSIRTVITAGKTKKRASNSPKSGVIQSLGETDTNIFDRDLYMQINKLTVSHDNCQSSSRDPFFVPEYVPQLSEVPTAYLTFNLGQDGQESSNKKNTGSKSIFSRLRLKRK